MSTELERGSNIRWRARLGVLVLLALAGTLLVSGGTAGVSASGHEHLDAPDGFHPTLLAPPAGFVDDVALQLRFRYDEPGANQGATVARLSDAGNVVVARVTWDPEGTSGWHTHPGPVVVSIVEGELEVTNASDCVARTYRAGEVWVDPGQGNVHTAVNPSAENETVVVATFFGVPPGQPATEHVAPADC
ncbi:cupin domain-containing protein [Nitriliruptor alkaliphilus]|uniref:cupin domain-containing protein n=1 Tax=Nitriliruptor alkaliphilus TaxID=427918 RepID=UPI000698BDBC|nr:cupin domain-containing protein [Nitriliruptor alkaliphilus]